MEAVSEQVTCLSADCDSDHSLVMLTVILRFRKQQVDKSLILNLEKPSNGECLHEYQIEMGNRSERLETAS